MRCLPVCDTGCVQGAFDVAVIGAGVSGLAAFGELTRAGLKVVCLEARERIGGRILTIHDALSPIPIELGAEFVHGRPKQIWDIIEAARLPAYDCTETVLRVIGGRVVDSSDAWLPVEQIMHAMQDAAEHGPDQTFYDFLQKINCSDSAKKLATQYIEGFNAARADIAGIAGLARDARAADAIDGDRSFRMLSGYDAIPRWLLEQADASQSELRVNSVVQRIDWTTNPANIVVRSSVTGEVRQFEARKVIVTVPLGVLQAPTGQTAAIEFDPVPHDVLQAASKLRAGQVVRLILRFNERLWEEKPEFSDAGFLLSDGPVFPTWWTPLPFRASSITGWSAGPASDSLLGMDRATIVTRAIAQLAEIFGLPEQKLANSLQADYYHDWHGDPFSRGAYSYVPAGALGDHDVLSEPVGDSLYFAGEATEASGHGATVHGAIASGRRAARQVLDRCTSS